MNYTYVSTEQPLHLPQDCTEYLKMFSAAELSAFSSMLVCENIFFEFKVSPTSF